MKRKILAHRPRPSWSAVTRARRSKLVADLVGVSNGSPFFHYGNKEGVLLEFVKRMFSGQFRIAERLTGDATDPLMLYGLETALQMHIVELSEPLRELYVSAYTLPSTAAYINEGHGEEARRDLRWVSAEGDGERLGRTRAGDLRHHAQLYVRVLHGELSDGGQAAQLPLLLLQALRGAARYYEPVIDRSSAST